MQTPSVSPSQTSVSYAAPLSKVEAGCFPRNECGAAKSGPTKALSPREIDAMTLLAVGYSRAQVANELSISEHTLRVYIESARFKLGAMNTTHAVARAMNQGLIVV